MIGRLIEKKNVGLEEHSTGESQLHLPTTRKGTNGLGLAGAIKADGGKNFLDFSLIGENALVIDDELKNGDAFFTAIDVMFDVESADLVRRRETFDLSIGDSPHESRLSSTVLAAKTVAVATLETKFGSVKQDLGTVGERELAVAKVFTLFLVLRNFFVIHTLSSGADNPFASYGNTIRGSNNTGEVGSKSLPSGNLKDLGINEVGRED